MGEHFKGFSQESLKFLEDIKKNNNRTWYEENKDRHKKFILEPFQNLFVDLYNALIDLEPELEMPSNPSKAVSRIYRDIRFSKDKTPFRSNVWLSLKKMTEDWKEIPTFYFELEPDSYGYGMGFYTAKKDTMDNFRSFIKDKPNDFRKAINFLDNKVFELRGDSYKRISLDGVETDLIPWYNKKSFYLAVNYPINDLLFKEELSEIVARDLLSMKDIYNFIWKII